MKKKGLLKVLVLLLMLAFVGKGTSVFAYEASDIARIYITSDTQVNELIKEYVDAQVVVVDKNGTELINDEAAQIKLRGNSTAKAEKKPFKIKLSSKQELLGMDKGKKWNVLANAFDKTLIRNKLCLDFANNMGLAYTSQSRFVDLYYNDVFLGSYLVTEPIEAGTNQVDIKEDGTDFMIEREKNRNEANVTYIVTKNGVRFAIEVPEEPTEEQKVSIENRVNAVENALASYKMSEYAKYIDVDSFVNYYIVNEIFKTVDFNRSSSRFYYKDGKMYAGPVWDYDLSSGNASKIFYFSYYEGNISYRGLYCTQHTWFGYLIKSDEFVAKVNQRLATMLPVIENIYKTNSIGKNQIDLLISEFGASFNRNYAEAGWSLTKRYSTCHNIFGLEYDLPSDIYSENVEYLRTWLANRVLYLKSEWADTTNNKINSLTVTKKAYNSVKLSWCNFGTVTPDGCEIYYKTPKGSYKLYKDIAQSGAEEYVVSKLKPGITYIFRVRSYLKYGNQKTYTAFTTINKKLSFKSPSCKVKKLSSKKYKISWKKVKGADGYIIYAKTKKKGSYKKVKTVTGNKKFSYTKKNCKASKKYYFKVKAYTKSDGKKYMSN